MAVFNNTIITKKGQALIAKIVAGTTATFTKIRTSNHDYPATTDFENLTVLGSIKQEISPSQIAVENSSTVRIKAVIANSGLTTGYSLKNIGLYALDPTEGEILFSITTTSVSDFIPSYNGTNISYINIDLLTSVSNSQNVNLTVLPGGLVTRDMLDVELGKYVLKTLQATETVPGITKYGTLSGTALEGYQMARILGIPDGYYGGLISDIGTKLIGHAYYDKNTKQMYLCKIENSFNYLNLDYFDAFSNKSLLDKFNTFSKQEVTYVSNPVFSRVLFHKIGKFVSLDIFYDYQGGVGINWLQDGIVLANYPAGFKPVDDMIGSEHSIISNNNTNNNIARLVLRSDHVEIYGVSNMTHYEIKGTIHYISQ